MKFEIPMYKHPDFMKEKFQNAPDAIQEEAPMDSSVVIEEIRPLYLYTVDADEFVVNKLLDKGSLAATTMVTNVQDFITIVAKGLGLMQEIKNEFLQ